ncbi:MAG: hypothetical protein ACI4Q4_09375 [Oscillospiraceae bacterium]
MKTKTTDNNPQTDSHVAEFLTRTNKSAQAKRRADIGTALFYSIWLIALLTAVHFIRAGLDWLWGFLDDYEKSQPEKVISAVVDELQGGDLEAVILDVGFVPNAFEDDSGAREYIASLFDGEISYSKNLKESSDERLVYNIRCDKNTICALSLYPAEEKSEHGFTLYSLGEYSGITVPTHEITITAPDSAFLSINGRAFSGTPTSSRKYEEVSHFYGYDTTSQPGEATYTIGGFTSPVEVSARFSDGKPLSGTDADNVWTFSNVRSDIPEELSLLAVNASQTYAKYITADASLAELANYIPYDVPLYANVRDYQSKFYSYHIAYDFYDLEVSDYIIYSDACVSVRVKYTHYVSSGYYGEYEFPTDHTLYLAKHNGSWLVTDIVMN